ncbi:MAG: NAD(P)-dependent oxidoreductase [Nitrospiraceae bacterium]|nr:NAD(P)-dependent oxidoreductase [Nitrospiraceae bacterium]
MKHVLITGSSGFIGSALVKRLLQRGHELSLVSRDRRRLGVYGSQGARTIEADLGNRISLNAIDTGPNPIDAVVHLAASVSYFGRDFALHRVNVLGSYHLLQWAIQRGVRQYLFASSIEAMGTRGDPDPAGEEDCTPPVSSYGRSKLDAEHALLSVQNGNVNLLILRLGNIYGPGSSFLIPFLADVLRRQRGSFRYLPLVLNQVFQLLYIDDLVETLVSVIEQGGGKGTYILAGKEMLTLEELLNLTAERLRIAYAMPSVRKWLPSVLRVRTELAALAGIADFPAFLMAGENRGPRRTYRIDKAIRDLGFAPRTSPAEGIRLMLEGRDAAPEGAVP